MYLREVRITVIIRRYRSRCKFAFVAMTYDYPVGISRLRLREITRVIKRVGMCKNDLEDRLITLMFAVPILDDYTLRDNERRNCANINDVRIDRVTHKLL